MWSCHKGFISQVYILITGAKDISPNNGRAHTKVFLNDFMFYKNNLALDNLQYNMSELIPTLNLQGEVEQISLMKPKAQTPHDEGFLEYLEDIIGSNKYVERIEEASKQ